MSQQQEPRELERSTMIAKSAGVTETERLLADFCERSFLKLWSYPNPYKDDGHELCDLLAVFGDYVFIFFDRESELPEVPDKDPQVLWDRWKRNVIDRQVKTAHGAERYIRSGRPMFLDGKGTTPFPLAINTEKAIVHKIIVAHGAKEACEKASSQNIYGSHDLLWRGRWRPNRALPHRDRQAKPGPYSRQPQLAGCFGGVGHGQRLLHLSG